MPFATLNDVKDDDPDDKERQSYYNGGQGQSGGGSGQETLDPREFMKRARDEMGAVTASEHADTQGPPPSSAFAGAGHSLSGATVDGGTAPTQPHEHTITFWQNGFTLDDGPLRTADDPANAAFLAAVNRGQMPAELIGEDGNAEGDVHIVDKSGEPYKPPTVAEKPFQGQGRSMREEGSSSGAAAAPVADAQELTLDAAAPTTTLQVRLADGSRKIVKANHTHTILQVREKGGGYRYGSGLDTSCRFSPPRRRRTAAPFPCALPNCPTELGCPALCLGSRSSVATSPPSPLAWPSHSRVASHRSRSTTSRLPSPMPSSSTRRLCRAPPEPTW